MIRLGNYSAYKFWNSQDISQPGELWANRPEYIDNLSPNNMKKVHYIYVGNNLVYGDTQIYYYTLKFRSRINFAFHGNSHGNMRPSSEYCEAISSGYVEDIVRINTAFPTYICSQSLTSPGDIYIPHLTNASSPYSQEPWGRKETYQFSGTEHLVTPPIALRGVVPNSLSSGTGSELIYQKYTDRNLFSIDGRWRYVMQRRVHCDVNHVVKRDWDSEDSVSEDYYIEARKFSTSVSNNGLSNGYYLNAGNYVKAIPIGDRSLALGLVYRRETDPGNEGLFLITHTWHHGRNNPNNIWYLRSPVWNGLNPGSVTAFFDKAPMFTGYKHFDCYDTSWNVTRREITWWDDPNVDKWCHGDLNGTFEILENNNPVFSSITDYLNYGR